MDESLERTDNLMKSGQILKMLDQVQDTLGECQRSCHKMDETNTRKSGSRSLEEHTNVIEHQIKTTQDHSHAGATAPAAQAKAHTAAQVQAHVSDQSVQDNWVPNKFQEMSLGQYRKKHSISAEMGKAETCTESDATASESESGIASGSGITPGSYLSQDDIKTKSGYSTEEDGIILLNTPPWTSSRASWYPYSPIHNSKQPASDSDNNSLAVEFSDEERNQRMELPSTSSNSKIEDTTDKSDAKDRADSLSTVNRRRLSQSHFDRSTPKRSTPKNFTEGTFSPSSPVRQPTQNRRGRKTKWQSQKHESSDASSGTDNFLGRRSDSCDSSSTFNRNHPRASFIKAPRLSNYSNSTKSELIGPGSHHHSQPPLANPDVVSQRQDFLYKYVHPTQLPIFNNIPVLPAARPSLWPVGPVYFPTNPHMIIAFGQPQQHLHPYPQLPQQRLPHQQQQQPPAAPPSSLPQMASNPLSIPTSTTGENLTGQSADPTPTTSKQSASPMIRPEYTWLQKQLISPPTQTGPDGKPIKVKVKRPPLPDWMAVVAENCDSALVELKASRMASKERVYRMLVEEEYEYQRSHQQ